MMGNQRVSGLHLVFLSMFLVATEYMCFGAQNSTRSYHERERQALLEFKHSIEYEYGMLSSWVGTNCCSWKGVRCDGATGNVISIHLRGNYWEIMEYYPSLEEDNYLVGVKVNTYLAELRHLRHMDLSGNNFQGSQIPEFIGSFKQLSYLNLSNAGFSGIIPHHIGNLSNLKVLDLNSYYYFTQSLIANDVAWVSSLSSLDHLDLSYVDLFKAKNIDMVFHIIPSLTYLSLRYCTLYPVNLGLHLNSSKILPTIQHLDLGFNHNFEGQLPQFFQNMTSLLFLDLTWYDLSQAWNSLKLLNTIPSLLELHMSGCGLHNTHLSSTYFNSSAHSNIEYLDLSQNSIEGIPSELLNMSSLRVLDLSENSLNSSIQVMPNLLNLDVSYNKFDNIELVGIWRQCHLKELRLSFNHFGGEMIGPSPNTSECSQYALEMLDLANNQLSGSVPEYIGRLTNLRVLNLKYNNLTGSIPKALERLRSLEVLDLSNNAFNGSIPESFGRLTGLTRLDLESNRLTGAIPTSLGRLDSLQALSVASNLLTGPIPVSVGKLTKLVHLDLSKNALEGVIFEAHIANLSMLKYLYIGPNDNLIVNVSHEWTPRFQLINFRSCKIANGFPKWLQNQRKLKSLSFSNASLDGLLPATFFQNTPMLEELDLSHNKISGPLPRSLCKTRRLRILDVSSNQLSGSIPKCVENLHDLDILILSSNGFSGVLPSSLGNFSWLRWLKLNDCNFNGEIPPNLENLYSLVVLDLGNNEFSGSIPKWIGENFLDLTVLILHKNNFTGGIPQSLCRCPNLQILDIAHNNFKGSIPHCFGELVGMIVATLPDLYNGADSSNAGVTQVMKGTQLGYTTNLYLVINMDLSSNKLTGEIPPEITALVLLMGLNLSHNHLIGSIPDNIGNMKALNSLDLSDNLLTGMIPPSTATLNFLSVMNLSHNNLSGRIPTGNQLQTLTNPSMYAGNRDLCGVPLPNNCSNHENSPTTTSKNEPNNVWFYLDITCGFATGFWGIIGVLLFKKQWRRKLFMIAEVAIDKIYVMVAVRVSKIKRWREA